jgi:hypothetical protein
MDNRFVDALLTEISEEKAASLGRAGNTLENALAELAAFDAEHDRTQPARQEQRRRLLWRLARLVTNFIVQREACGLRDPEYVLDFYKVPREVVELLGKRATMIREHSERRHVADSARETDG